MKITDLGWHWRPLTTSTVDYPSNGWASRVYCSGPLSFLTEISWSLQTDRRTDRCGLLPFDGRVMPLLLWSAHGVDQTVQYRDAHAIARHRHVRAARPAVGPRVETVHPGRVLVGRIWRVVPTPHHVDLAVNLKPRTERRNWTELNWHDLVFDELTAGQAVMHHSRHCLMASVSTWLRARTCQPMTNGLAAGLPVGQFVKN